MKKLFCPLGCILLFIAGFLLLPPHLFAQPCTPSSASEILQDLKKLRVLGRVLYVAAHPDDENNHLLAYLANEGLYTTGYLSLTRGDGGQNRLGPEMREELGIIRTQELLQARRLDGGYQFFTRANDFGFSKNPAETFTIWDKEQLLADMVWVIRTFRPDVIITRFSPLPAHTHGHHTASAMLAVEAFEAAADPKRFPEQLTYVKEWKAKRLLWNRSNDPSEIPQESGSQEKELLQIDIGKYNPLLGKSYGEIAAQSRSMHKSQAMGVVGTRGKAIESLQLLKGDKASTSLFEGIPTSWARVKGGEKIGKLLDKAIQTYQPAEPAAVVATLLAAQAELGKLPDGYWKRWKEEEMQQVIRKVMGLYAEALAEEEVASPGDTVRLRVEIVNRSAVAVTLQGIRYPFTEKDPPLNTPLPNNQPLVFTTTTTIPKEMPYSQPYWLRRKGSLGMFSVDNQQEVGLPENRPAAEVIVSVQIAGQPLQLTLPVHYKRADPTEGEVYEPFVVAPPVFVNLSQKVYVFADQEPKSVQVRVKAGQAPIAGEVALQLPPDWRAEPLSIPVDLPGKRAEQEVNFLVYPPPGAREAEIRAVVSIGQQTYDQGCTTIRYHHIPTQVTFPVATARVVKLDLRKKGEHIGYVMGAGDKLPTCLQQIGYQVTLLKDEQLDQKEDLQQFDAIILGVRAYNTVERLQHCQNRLMAYVKAGGNLIVQYNTEAGLLTKEIGPYPITLSSERVAVEKAEVRFLNPGHPVLNTPNKITGKDFEGWVQEQGLCFPKQWSPQYETVLSSNDPGEPALNGGLLIARYGKGNYLYTSYAWFRELPSGVPGAYRLFANLISLGK